MTRNWTGCVWVIGIRGSNRLVERANVGMGECGDEGLTLETPAGVRIRGRCEGEPYRDRSIQPNVPRPIYLAHPTRPA